MDKNIIIDGRIVSDETFALRLKNFIEATQVMDAASEEEKEYLLYVAKQLLHHQVVTLTDKAEKQYLMQNGVIRPKRTIEDLKKAISRIPHNRGLQAINKKTGNKYLVLGLLTNSTNAVDGQLMVVYTDGKGPRYCREISEFVNKFEW